MMTLLLTRDIPLPPSSKGQSVARRPDSVARDLDSVSLRGPYWIDFNRKSAGTLSPESRAGDEAPGGFARHFQVRGFAPTTCHFTESVWAQRLSELAWQSRSVAAHTASMESPAFTFHATEKGPTRCTEVCCTDGPLLPSARWRIYWEPRPYTWNIRLRWCSRRSRSASTRAPASASWGETATASPACCDCSPVNCYPTRAGSPTAADCGSAR